MPISYYGGDMWDLIGIFLLTDWLESKAKKQGAKEEREKIMKELADLEKQQMEKLRKVIERVNRG
jgi:hypothetical protein